MTVRLSETLLSGISLLIKDTRMLPSLQKMPLVQFGCRHYLVERKSGTLNTQNQGEGHERRNKNTLFVLGRSSFAPEFLEFYALLIKEMNCLFDQRDRGMDSSSVPYECSLFTQ